MAKLITIVLRENLDKIYLDREDINSYINLYNPAHPTVAWMLTVFATRQVLRKSDSVCYNLSAVYNVNHLRLHRNEV